MRNCETCGIEKPETEFYGHCGRNGKRYPLTPGSNATRNCKSCANAGSKKAYEEVMAKKHTSLVCVCSECGTSGNSEKFTSAKISSAVAGFPTFCRACDYSYVKTMREKWPLEKQEERKKKHRDTVNAYRHAKKLKEEKICLSCKKTKTFADFTKTCSEPFKHKWYVICKVCEAQKI